MIIYSDIISSRNNNTVKWAASLAQKKGRDSSSCFIAEGEKLSLEALDAGLPVTHIFISESKKAFVMEKLSGYISDTFYEKTELITLSDGAFEKISTENAPQGIISVIKYLDFFRDIDIIYKEDFFVLPSERIIILCSVRDPGNLGAVIRSAAAFGVEHIIITADSADIYNPKTVRSAMGSLFRVKISIVKDISSFVTALIDTGRRVFAAELSDGARSVFEVALKPTDAIIIGNEGHGIPKELSNQASGSVFIPISKKTESLNAAVAAAVFMWEQSKQTL
ncbi:MAG: RNA methyltransferase [Ruminococcaceae bacterium]|nr:RNA methyltransferase [Oscillospiraceae bacterium]